MKKLFIAVALVMGLGTSVAFANEMTAGIETVAMVNEYKPIEAAKLPQAVQDAIKKNYAESTIKEASVDEAAKTYKVILTGKDGKIQPLYSTKRERFKNNLLICFRED